MKTLNVGIIGCGKIAAIYAQNLQNRYADRLRLLLCADLDMQRAQAFAGEYGVRAVATETLLASPEIDVVLNLTIPSAHFTLSMAALQNGKHVYSEKPLAAALDEGKQLAEEARKRRLYLGCAPDTFLGGGIQTVQKLLGDGAIGTPVSFAIHMLACGPERTHPRPEFYYQPGAGPLMDMGPYYITALVALLGPVKRVMGMGGSVFPVRTCQASERLGDTFEAAVNTSTCALIEMQSGLMGTLHVSWDHPHRYWESGAPLFEIRGSDGRMECPDPNTFGGSYGAFFDTPENIIRFVSSSGEQRSLPLLPDAVTCNARGLGLYQAAEAMAAGSEPAVNAALALHVLEVLLAIEQSCQSGRSVAIGSDLS